MKFVYYKCSNCKRFGIYKETEDLNDLHGVTDYCSICEKTSSFIPIKKFISTGL